jgi:extradiol dioxygenase family protein
MTHGIKALIYPVKDLANAKTLYSALLGVPPSMDEA